MRYVRTIGKKGRVNLAEAKRKTGGEGMLRRIGNFFIIYTLAEWEEIEERLKNLPLSPESHRVQRRIVGKTPKIKFDKWGRFYIPRGLRGGISGKVTIITLD